MVFHGHRTPAGVSIVQILADSSRITIVKRSVEAFVDHLATQATRLHLVRRIVDIPIAAALD